MDCDLLLAWMTHVGEGSWARFRSAVEELAGSDADAPELCRRLRIALSDLAFADFFIEGSQQWRMLPPVLGGLSGQHGAALLCGSRTPSVVESLKSAAGAVGCKVNVEKPKDCPALIGVASATEQLTAIADHIGAAYQPNFSSTVAQKLTPIPDALDDAQQEAAPLNWKARCFDFGTSTWVDELLPNSACEYTPTYGRSKHFVRRKRGRLLRLSKRESIYAAAMLNGVRLVEYSPEDGRLKVPLFAPLPELYSRAACLCRGRPAEVVDGHIMYSGVPADLAAVLMVAAGQPHPGVESSAGTGR